jgi:hypothetical protein
MAQMAKGLPPFQTTYDEKLKVGYKWYDAQKKSVCFPFGFGLSYTTYAYSGTRSEERRRTRPFPSPSRTPASVPALRSHRSTHPYPTPPANRPSASLVGSA